MGENLKSAGEAIENVRADRGLTQSEAATAAGISGTSWNVIANGRERVSARIAGKVMAWCGWTADSYERLLRGEEPKERPTMQASLGGLGAAAQVPEQRQTPLEQFEERLRRVEAMVEKLVSDRLRAE